MAIQIEHLEDHTARLSVDVSQDRVERAMQRAAKRIANKVTVPGFRKGKAPYNVILRYFGAQAVLEEATESLANEIYSEALKESNIEPYSMGNLENIETEPQMRMVFIVPKTPQVSLGAYRDIRLPYEEPTVTEADVEAALKRLQDSRATVEDVERPAQLGDLVNFTVFGTVAPAPQEAAAPEGEAAADESTEAATPEASTETATETTPEASTETDDEPELFIEDEIDEFVLTENAEADVVPGFSAQVIGMSAGEERTFDVTLPEDFQDEEYRNRVVTFKVNLSSVKSRTLPEMNDEFVKTVTDGEHETVEALRTRVQTDLQEDALRTAKSKYADDVLSKVLEGAEIKYPPQMVDQYIHDIIDDLERNLRNRNLSMETYMQISGKTHEDLHHDYEQPAIDRIKRNVVVSEIVKAEQLAITNEEIDAHVEKLTQRFGDSTQASSFRDMLNRDESRRSIAFDLVMERVVDRLAQIGRGEAPELPAPVVAENANMEAAPVAESTNTGTSAEAEVASSETEDAAKE